MHLILSFINPLDLSTLMNKTKIITYVHRTRVEAPNDITIMQLLVKASAILIEREALHAKYYKSAERKWMINSYWVQTENSYMVPLSQKDIVKIGPDLSTTPSAGAMYSNPQDHSMFSSMPDDVLFDMLRKMDRATSKHVKKMWSSNIHLEHHNDEIYFEITK